MPEFLPKTPKNNAKPSYFHPFHPKTTDRRYFCTKTRVFSYFYLDLWLYKWYNISKEPAIHAKTHNFRRNTHE